jgi:branched-chain amino acid transport system substrate-binding protein
MKERSKGSRHKLLVLVAVLVLALAAVAAGCGGDDEEEAAAPPPAETEAADTGAAAGGAETTEAAEGTPIKIGHLSNCEGPFGPFYGQTLAGSMLALVDRGATPVDPADPAKGVEGAVVAGHPIEVVLGCSDATPEKALEEARRLVEQENVDILLGPLSGSEGIALANYSKEQPQKTFVNGTSGAQDTTLKVRSPNFFRFNTDGAQWTAGLGAYAYNVLGWRRVVTMGDDYDFPYTQVAGFVAEFCSLGGEVVGRLWPALGEEDYASFIADIPSDVDGFFLGVGGTGTVAFVKQYTQLKGNLADKIMGGVFMTDPIIQQELGERIVGVVTAGPTAGDSTDQAYVDYQERLGAAFTDFADDAPSVFTYNYYNNMEAILQGLEAVNGDLSDGQAAFQEALAGIVLDTPFGELKLDENRQAIANNFLQQLQDENNDGTIEVKTIATAETVDATFGGAFSEDTPTPDRQNPTCEKGTPGPWTEAITKEALGQ